MRENNIELQNRFEMQIDNSNLSADNKEYMKRIVDGIMKSPKGRLYLINDPQFQKYITFRKDMSMPNPALDYCVVSVMKNPDTGFTEGRDYNFPGLKGFCELARENERVLASELVNSQNYQRVQSGAPRVEKEQPSEDPKQKCKRLVKESIEKLANVPNYKKQRVYDVLDMIDKAGKIKVQVIGAENIPKEDGFMFFPNHQGLYDVLAILESCERPFAFVIKKVPFEKTI